MVLQNPSDPLSPCFQPRQKPSVHLESRWIECFHCPVLRKVLPFQHLGNVQNINLFFFFVSYIFTQNPLVERNQSFLRNLIIRDLLKILGNNCLFFVLPKDLLYQHLGNKIEHFVLTLSMIYSQNRSGVLNQSFLKNQNYPNLLNDLVISYLFFVQHKALQFQHSGNKSWQKIIFSIYYSLRTHRRNKTKVFSRIRELNLY